MALVIKGKTPAAPAPAVPTTAAQVIETMVAAQELTPAMADNLLAQAPAVQAAMDAEVTTPAVSEEPAPAPVKKGGLHIVKKPAAAPSPELEKAMTTIANLPVEGQLKPGEPGFQEQVAEAFNMDIIVANGISVLTPKREVTEKVVQVSDAPASASPFTDVVVEAAAPTAAAPAVPMDAIQLAEQEAGYTILDALKELCENKIGTLMFVNRESGLSYTVLGHNPKTNITTMKNSSGIKLHPILGEREVAQYRPIWR